MQTSAQPAETRFLHLLEHDARHDYPLAGRTWSGMSYGTSDQLSLHIPDHPLGYVMLRIRAATEAGRFHTEWTVKLAEGVYAHHHSYADSAEAAARALLAYAPEVVQDEISGHTWLRLSANKWITHFDGQRAEIRKDACGLGYLWERDFPPAKKLLAMTALTSYALHGTADTPELAMLAAEHAPADLRRACAELVVAIRPATPEN